MRVQRAKSGPAAGGGGVLALPPGALALHEGAACVLGAVAVLLVRPGRRALATALRLHVELALAERGGPDKGGHETST